MKNQELIVSTVGERNISTPVRYIHTIVLGSGAAGLNAAARLFINGIKDVAILTEGLRMGTSINTGSDKQTYYKLSLCGNDTDSPKALAETLFSNGSMHGDLALVEAAGSIPAFMNLVNLGVQFPRDEYGQFVGYKTDHDPLQRATSIGPYTSREMCRRLIAQVKDLGIEILQGMSAVELVTVHCVLPRVCGVIVINSDGDFEAYMCENLVFAVGGPGGLYKTSAYPLSQTGAIGLALMAGAKANNLSESQFGIASTKFRWNVSGSYMQVIPRIISRGENGPSDEKEFLRDYFNSPGALNGLIFLKGYQWPFDANKVIGGSSLIDILIHNETIINGRRVYLDYRANSGHYSIDDLPSEAQVYLKKSGAVQNSPYERLLHMNPSAVEHYRNHNIDLSREPLEVSVCAQHNNGGLAGNIWYESVNLKHLFPIGEVNGSHGVTRPGGAALNAGQVAGFRAAEYISNQYSNWTLTNEAKAALVEKLQGTLEWTELLQDSENSWRAELREIQERMTRYAGHIRSSNELERAVSQAQEQVNRLNQNACNAKKPAQRKFVFRVRQLAIAQLVYLEAIKYSIQSGVGSRGSAIILEPNGQLIHDNLSQSWRIAQEDISFRSKVLETVMDVTGKVENQWTPVRPIPEADPWFETSWSKFRNGEIYKSGEESSIGETKKNSNYHRVG